MVARKDGVEEQLYKEAYDFLIARLYFGLHKRDLKQKLQKIFFAIHFSLTGGCQFNDIESMLNDIIERNAHHDDAPEFKKLKAMLLDYCKAEIEHREIHGKLSP
jgi:hypothetical protein